MILISLHSNSINLNKLEQRLIQIFGYYIGAQFLHELMYLGMEYTFKFSTALNLENIKGNFYMSNILYSKTLFNLKSLFTYIFRSNYTTNNYNSFNLFKNFYTIINKLNPILNILDFIIQIGARSNPIQYKQIVGMRGFLNTSRGQLINIPLLHNFERGLNLTEYLISAYGVRKGLLDTSLQTSESGYLTRRLVEVIQDIVIKEHSCGSNKLLILRKYNTIHGYIHFPNHQMLFTKYLYNSIDNKEFYIKSPILCFSGRTVCVKCSGFGCNIKILGGESIGVIFGELLGEPSTQLTLRTFHTGGILHINNQNNIYIFKNKFTCTSWLNFKNISFKAKKNLIKFKFNFFNKYKFIFDSTLYKNLIIPHNKFYLNYLPSITNLVIYKFNLLPIYPIIKNYSKNFYNISKNLTYNFLINIYSTNILLKNKILEWTMLLLNNNLNYCIIDYIPEQFVGGIYLSKNNMIKTSIIFNTNIIY